MTEIIVHLFIYISIRVRGRIEWFTGVEYTSDTKWAHVGERYYDDCLCSEVRGD